MTSGILVASVLITLALICYSIGVWSERIAGRLKAWHLVFFWCGLAFDSTGTGIMFEVADRIGTDVHSLSGIVAIVLMFVHAAWATAVLVRRDEKAITRFHHFSVFVWAVWLIPYFTGFFVSMR
jgi:uncharacterized repeat protein (TIGR03987 family)